MFSPEEFAARNDISRTRVYHEIRSGRLVARKIGHLTRIAEEDEDAWRAALPLAGAQ
jgi:hypothetical protein